jgi:hypothetical protein
VEVLCSEQLRVFDMANFTAQTPSSLLLAHKLFFKFDVFKAAYPSNFALKSHN